MRIAIRFCYACAPEPDSHVAWAILQSVFMKEYNDESNDSPGDAPRLPNPSSAPRLRNSGRAVSSDVLTELEGEVVEVLWRYPHARARLQVVDDDGEETIWELELGPPPNGF